MLNYRCFLIVSMVCFFSCKKEKDSIKPVILLASPFENQAFQVPGEIIVKGNVEDDKKIDFVRVSLFTEEMTTAAPSQLVKASGSKVEINVTMAIEGPSLKSGNYFLTITASDGENESKLFRKIQIHGSQRDLKGIFVVSKDGSKTNVELIGSNGTKNNFYTQSGDYIGSSLSQQYQSFTLAGERNGDAVSLRIRDKTVLWKEESFSQSTPTFTALNLMENANYVSYYSGVTVAKEEFGTTKVSFEAYPGFLIKEVINSGDRTVAFQKEISGNKMKMCVYFKGTGAFFHQMFYDYDIKSMCPKTEGEVLAFGNKDSKGFVTTYAIEKNYLKDAKQLTGGEVRKAIKGDENYYYTSSSGIYKLDVQSGLGVLLKAGNYSAVEYDDVNKQIYVAEGARLDILDAATGSLAGTYSFSGAIAAIHCWYNK